MGKKIFEKRPAFRVSAKRAHNKAANKYGLLKSDSCHRIPYKTIKEYFESYLSNQLSFDDFTGFINLLYGNVAHKEKNKVILLLKDSNLNQKPRRCREILSILNSAEPNLRPGSPRTNRRIGAKLDLSIKDWQFTPQSKKILLQPPKNCNFSFSKNKQLRLSFFQTGAQAPCGKEISPNKLTPDSYRLFNSAITNQEKTKEPSTSKVGRKLF
ncbi:hypothetical protein [Fluoribacter gormanii]|uniref:hypothetical protein n=1 Tax=Fluoribacter gormanii TaxID=464 RepID=UPI0010419EB2|nr:hypothetical protein [Fluoribacter gormanii]